MRLERQVTAMHLQVEEGRERRSLGIFDSNLTVAGSGTGALVSAVIVMIAWIALPIARPFLVGTVGLGLLVGAVLRWKHREF